MNEQRFCPHCGERIALDTEQQYCMFCGEPLVDFVPQAAFEPEPSYKPKWWQTLAATLFFSVMIGQLLLETLYPESLGLFGFFIPLIMAIGFGILLNGIKNRATFVALIIIIVIDLLFLLFIFLPAIPVYSSWAWMNDLFLVIRNFIIPLSSVYALALIARNNVLTGSCRAWLHILILGDILALFWSTLNFWFPQDDFISIGWTYPFAYIFMFNNTLLRVLFACSWWVVARSKAFGGPYNKETSCDFSPLNKYMAMTVIAPAILIPLMLLIFNYAEELINL